MRAPVYRGSAILEAPILASPTLLISFVPSCPVQPRASHPTPSHPVPSYPIQPVPSHPMPSRPAPSNHFQPRPPPSHSKHPVPSHVIALKLIHTRPSPVPARPDQTQPSQVSGPNPSVDPTQHMPAAVVRVPRRAAANALGMLTSGARHLHTSGSNAACRRDERNDHDNMSTS